MMNPTLQVLVDPWTVGKRKEMSLSHPAIFPDHLGMAPAVGPGHTWQLQSELGCCSRLEIFKRKLYGYDYDTERKAGDWRDLERSNLQTHLDGFRKAPHLLWEGLSARNEFSCNVGDRCVWACACVRQPIVTHTNTNTPTHTDRHKHTDTHTHSE